MKKSLQVENPLEMSFMTAFSKDVQKTSGRQTREMQRNDDEEKTIHQKTCDSCLRKKECKEIKKKPKRDTWPVAKTEVPRLYVILGHESTESLMWLKKTKGDQCEGNLSYEIKDRETESNEEQLLQDIHYQHTENPRLQEQKCCRCSFWQFWPQVSTNPFECKIMMMSVVIGLSHLYGQSSQHAVIMSACYRSVFKEKMKNRINSRKNESWSQSCVIIKRFGSSSRRGLFRK